MATLTEVKIKKLREFRTGILDLKKAELTPKLISSYWESNRDKLRQPWQSVQKSRILHKTIEVDFKGHILCINDVRKWRRKWQGALLPCAFRHIAKKPAPDTST